MPRDRILVIDDEKEILKLLEYNLQKEGYEILTAEDGEKGFEMAKSEKPDLIILDLMLPGTDGFDICRMLKAERDTKPIPILMLTAKNSEVDHVLGLELGASDFLSKPFSVKILIAHLKNILKASPKKAVVSNGLLTAGGFELDRERFLFKIKDKPVSLTKIEFQILTHFMENPEIVISRDKIVKAVWNQNAVVSDVSVNMHVLSLRKKLGKWRGSVQSVRGIGYRFLPEIE